MRRGFRPHALISLLAKTPAAASTKGSATLRQALAALWFQVLGGATSCELLTLSYRLIVIYRRDQIDAIQYSAY